jgi:hypothetical protein
MSILTDFLGYMVLYNGKSSILTAIETDMINNLATAKNEVTTFGQKVANTFAAATPSIQASLAGQSGDLHTKDVSTPLTDAAQWNAQTYILPASGDNNFFLYAYVHFTTVAANTSAVGYVGLLGANDSIGSITTLSSMPTYSTIYGGARPTPFSYPSGDYTKNVITGQFEALTQTMIIPINSRIKTNGIALYTWDEGTAGFSFDSMGFVYRNDVVY